MQNYDTYLIGPQQYAKCLGVCYQTFKLNRARFPQQFAPPAITVGMREKWYIGQIKRFHRNLILTPDFISEIEEKYNK